MIKTLDTDRYSCTYFGMEVVVISVFGTILVPFLIFFHKSWMKIKIFVTRFSNC